MFYKKYMFNKILQNKYCQLSVLSKCYEVSDAITSTVLYSKSAHLQMLEYIGNINMCAHNTHIYSGHYILQNDLQQQYKFHECMLLTQRTKTIPK